MTANDRAKKLDHESILSESKNCMKKDFSHIQCVFLVVSDDGALQACSTGHWAGRKGAFPTADLSGMFTSLRNRALLCNIKPANCFLCGLSMTVVIFFFAFCFPCNLTLNAFTSICSGSVTLFPTMNT